LSPANEWTDHRQRAVMRHAFEIIRDGSGLKKD